MTNFTNIIDPRTVKVGDRVTLHNYKNLGLPVGIDRYAGKVLTVSKIKQRHASPEGEVLIQISEFDHNTWYGYEWFTPARQRPTVAQVKALEDEVEQLSADLAAEGGARLSAQEEVAKLRNELQNLRDVSADRITELLARVVNEKKRADNLSEKVTRLLVQIESDDQRIAELQDERDDALVDTAALEFLTGYIAQEFPEVSPQAEAFLIGVYSALKNTEEV